MPTSIRLAPDIEQRLDALAKQTGRSKAYYLRELIERGLGDMEDRYLAEKRFTDGKPLVRVMPDEP
ncbi:MAG: ribbon-helix-helix protein, CopG family [Rhodocyclaceae bacterium]|nr:ribbon-helix-helix protein, CopG family [Rhodocyclaceae bacterium]